jgi:hypothetical protein
MQSLNIYINTWKLYLNERKVVETHHSSVQISLFKFSSQKSSQDSLIEYVLITFVLLRGKEIKLKMDVCW